jgi:hypothetical protein
MMAAMTTHDLKLHRGDDLHVTFAPDPVTESAEGLQDEVNRLKTSIELDWKPWVGHALDNNTLLRSALRNIRDNLAGMASHEWEEVTHEVGSYIASVLDASKDRR